MRKPQGYAQLVGPGLSGLTDPGLASLNKWGECDTFTCAHCNRVVHVPSQTDASTIGGMCRSCMGLVCPDCVNLGYCVPFEAKLEENLRKASIVGEWF